MKRNRRITGKLINWQKTIETDTGKPCGEGSPYWVWMEKYGRKNEDGDILEFASANPDVLTDYDDDYEKRREHYQDIIEEVYESLSQREKQVFYLLGQGYSVTEIATKLRISQPRVSACRKVMRKKLDSHRYKNPYRV